MAHDGKRWSNADQDRVDLVEYDPTWPAHYEAEGRAIRTALAGLASFGLAHFGSTAIPGLVAKPIIDIMLTVPDQSAWPALIEPIESLGYVYWADNPRRDRMFFVKGMPPFGARRTHHIHVRTPDDARTALLFTDHLRRHPDEAARYAALKRELAARHSTDRDAYTAGKARYVDDIVRKAESR
ncbi:MAG: GrpB family protein [Candidatus Rokuibacteriota bacterium]